MSYRIELRREALRELKRLPAYVRAEALEKIDSLETDPRPARAQELRGKPGAFRLWVAANWRLAYGVDDDNARIWILRIRHKDSIDYESVSWEVHEPAGPEYSTQLVARATISDDFWWRTSNLVARRVGR